MAGMKIVSLRKPYGARIASVEIPDEVIGPDVIEHGGMVYFRITHDVYHEATRLVIRDAVSIT